MLIIQGLAFSVRKGVRIPPSLRNIYKEMHDEVPSFTIPKHGYVHDRVLLAYPADPDYDHASLSSHPWPRS
jgi:uracil-DNA glycosylase